MADYSGGILEYFVSLGEINAGKEGLIPSDINDTSKYFKGRPCAVCELGESGSTRQYLKRARDLGSGPPAIYIEWVTTDINSLPPTSPPIGPWGEVKILAEW